MTQKVEELIILGAGASKADGAPLQNDLIKDFFNFDCTNSRKNCPKLKYGKDLKDYFLNFWGFDPEKDCNNSPSFEECLGMLDIAFNRNESFRGYSSQKISRLRNELIFLIAKALNDSLKGKRLHHNSLIERLDKEDKLKNTAFLSLNYDILIDNAIVDFKGLNNIDYGIEFADGYFSKDSVNLLKPHGSLNWTYCPTCCEIFLTEYQKSGFDVLKSQMECKNCESILEPVIIPPTYFKEFSNPYLQQIYYKADQVIREVSKVYICGYSFSDADIHVKYLLKRAEMFNKKTPEIYIINCYEGKTEADVNNEKDRFNRFFKDKNKIRYLEEISFEKFCNSGIE